MKSWRRQTIFWAFAMSVFAATVPVSGVCGGSGPGATLLFPYFEVDAQGGDGRTTLISIHNFSPLPHLTHVVLWSNCAVPILDFDLYLDAYALRSIDLRALLFEGQLPQSGPEGEAPPGCTSPLALPVFDPAELREKLTGAPLEGSCYAAEIDDPVVTGYLTVDVVQGCSDRLHTPQDVGYFSELAGDENVLTGELFLLDSPGDAAQGLSAVPLRFTEESAEGSSFYKRGDHRESLPAVHQVHYLNGGAFDGGTDLLYWLDSSRPEDFGGWGAFPWLCSQPESECGGSHLGADLVLRGRNEAGHAPAPATVRARSQTLRAGRLRVGKDVPVAVPFGTLEVCFSREEYEYVSESSGWMSVVGQGWILPVHTAEGRYSAGLESVGLCMGDLPRYPPLVESPQWLQDAITLLECKPAVEPAREILRYTYQDQTVYLFPTPDCCDRFRTVYAENGWPLCAPSGGVGGEGDGQCPDFFEVATDMTLIWRDPRLPEAQ